MASTQPVSPWAHGIAVFAGVVMIIGGAFQALEGLAGIVHDKYLVVAPSTIYAFDVTVWGVIHLLVGLALLVIGVALLRARLGARRRHDRRRGLGHPKLCLAAVLAAVGDHGHRC